MKKYILSIIISFFLIGCGGATSKVAPAKLTNQDTEFLSNQPVKLQKSFQKLIQEGDRNKVLNYNKIALDAYQLGYSDIAKTYFDKALQDIESVYSDKENAEKARSLWYEEGKKDFKGEPYERAMAFYYRGLLYMEDADFENARASFRSAMLQDAFAEEEQNRCDFNLVMLLDGVSSKFNNDYDLYQEALKDVKAINPKLNIPNEYNTVFIIETGNSPRKVADGVGHSELKFRRGRKFLETSAYVSIDSDEETKAQLLEDIYWQSTSRGGRYFDSILKGKAQFKQMNAQVAETFADISSTISIVNSGIGSDTLGGVGVGLGVISGIALISSVNADARADTRYWNNLPDKVHVVFSKLPIGKHEVKISFRDKNGQLIESLTKTEVIDITSNTNFFRFTSRDRISYTYRK